MAPVARFLVVRSYGTALPGRLAGSIGARMGGADLRAVRLRRLLQTAASLGLLLANVTMFSACSAATAGDDGTGGSPPVPGATSLMFVEDDTLLLEPGYLGEVSVRVQPPGFHSVSFALVANPSDSAFDGFLDAATVVTDETGLAHNVVQAPTSSAVFLVRASVGDTLVATRTVSVSTEGFATLVATPAYSGVRSIGSWQAVASLNKTCSDLDDIWNDGALEAEGNENAVTLSGVPVGSEVALVVRAGQYVGGCVSISELDAGEVRELEVPVTDRPMQISGTSLELELDIEERTVSFVDLLGAAAARGAADYALGYGEDADVLFADCVSSIADSTDREAFLARAEDHGYADLLRAHLPSPTALREVVLGQLLDAAQRVDGPSVWSLVAELEGESSMLTLVAAAGVPVAMSGFLGSSDLSVVREPADRLVLGADLEFQATRWLGAIAESTEDTGPLEALLDAAQCEEVASAWLEAGALDVYLNCDQDCATALCEDGLRLGWDRARTTADDLTTLRVGISGSVEIDDEARPTALSGEWIGSVDAGALSVAGIAREFDASAR